MNFEYSSNNRLEFTGNWFIDAGIMGFVRLMEDVYGFSISELRELVKNNEKKSTTAFFPLHTSTVN